MCGKTGHKGKCCENLKRILPAVMLDKRWPGYENPPSDDQVSRLRQKLSDAKKVKDRPFRGRGGNRRRGGSTRGGSQAPQAKKRRLDDENDEGEDTVSTVSLADHPDLPDSEPHLAFKQVQARKMRDQQQRKDEEDRLAGLNAPTHEAELEKRVSELTKTLEKYQAFSLENSNKILEMLARIFDAESSHDTLQERLSDFMKKQKKFNDETNQKLASGHEQKKAAIAQKQEVASQYGIAVLEKQSLKTEIASLQAENQSLKAEAVRLNSEIAGLRNKEAGHNFTGAWDDDEE